jgi:hypothetical protein
MQSQRMMVRQPAMTLGVFKQVSPYVDREIHTLLEYKLTGLAAVKIIVSRRVHAAAARLQCRPVHTFEARLLGTVHSAEIKGRR